MTHWHWHVVEAAAVEPTPWRNGGGVTRELLRLPADGTARARVALAAGAGPRSDTCASQQDWSTRDDWMLRISVAEITADGAFSRFAGVERWFAVVDGAGVALEWGNAAHPSFDVCTPSSTPLCFDGDRAPGCRLLGGPTRDLNVMTRRDLANARVEPAQWNVAWQPSASAAGLFARVALELRAAGAPARRLPAQSLAWCNHPEASAWTVAHFGTDAAPQAQPGTSGAPPGWWISVSCATPPP